MTTQLTDDDIDAAFQEMQSCQSTMPNICRDYFLAGIKLAADRAKQAAPAQDDEADFQPLQNCGPRGVTVQFKAQDDEALLGEMLAVGDTCNLYDDNSMRAVLAVVRAHDAAKQAPPEQAAPTFGEMLSDYAGEKQAPPPPAAKAPQALLVAAKALLQDRCVQIYSPDSLQDALRAAIAAAS